MREATSATHMEEQNLMKAITLTTAALGCMVAATAMAGLLQINEIRIDQPGGDTDEYFELAGSPGQSLDGVTYVVIGDGSSAACGSIENATDLTGMAIQADGLLSVGEGGGTFTFDVELGAVLAFENSDNVTHMLVSGFTGAVGDDVDADDDGVMDSMPWAGILDRVGLDEGTVVDCAGTDEYLYSPVTVGPDGTFVPGHVFLCNAWEIGAFDPVGGDDTPGEPNNCSVPVEDTTWGSVKSLYR